MKSKVLYKLCYCRSWVRYTHLSYNDEVFFAEAFDSSFLPWLWVQNMLRCLGCNKKCSFWKYFMIIYKFFNSQGLKSKICVKLEILSEFVQAKTRFFPVSAKLAKLLWTSWLKFALIRICIVYGIPFEICISGGQPLCYNKSSTLFLCQTFNVPCLFLQSWETSVLVNHICLLIIEICTNCVKIDSNSE